MTFQSAIKDEEFSQEHGISQTQALVLLGVAIAEATKSKSSSSSTNSTGIPNPEPPKNAVTLAEELRYLIGEGNESKRRKKK